MKLQDAVLEYNGGRFRCSGIGLAGTGALAHLDVIHRNFGAASLRTDKRCAGRAGARAPEPQRMQLFPEERQHAHQDE
ncbi:MAG: hypothetical protein IT485_07990 [Gammaproteobacteria bacterium]|nr:hypothetical protein [Gammaproteobacteria bacterium]